MNEKELTKIVRITKQILSPQTITKIGHETGFTQRERDITGGKLTLSLIHALGTEKVETIADLQRSFNAMTSKNIKYKPFYNQLSKPEFPRFCMSVLEKVMNGFSLQNLTSSKVQPLRHFQDVVIQDGSSFALKNKLAETFPGRFTKTSPAAVELHATMSLFSDSVTQLSLAPDKEGERQFLPTPEELRGKLLLADRGYEDICYCDDVQNAEGSFIVRFKGQTNPTVLSAQTADFRRINLKEMPLQKALKKFRKKTIDLDVAWQRGKRTISYRLIVAWNRKKKQYWLLATNLPRNEFPVDVVIQYYRLRWQIELVFKEWKSYANLHKFDTANPHIAEGLIWASITAAFIKRYFAFATQQIFQTVEISTRKTSMCLKTHLSELVRALLNRCQIKTALRNLVRFLEQNAGRAHPKRDRLSGRSCCGLEAIFILDWGGLKV